MALTEQELKKRITEDTCNLYVLYGQESYLTEQYARLLARRTVEPDFEAFNLHRFDGQAVSMEQLEDAVETLPMMADRKCVLVRDMDVPAAGDRLLTLVEQVPESCVLVFWQMTLQPTTKKAWQDFLKTAEKHGAVARFDRKDTADVVKLLVAGAGRRGCTLSPADAAYLVEQAGNDLQLLLCELDKLSALAVEGVITRGVIDAAATKNLEARVFDLSKAVLSRRADRAYALLSLLKQQREEPVQVLGALSAAYVDMYRAKVAVNGGVPATAPVTVFKTTYKNKEFRLRNASRDAARLSVPHLRQCLEILARADRGVKGGGDGWLSLEEAVTRLLQKAGEVR